MAKKPDLSRLTRAPKGNLMSSREAIEKKNEIDVFGKYTTKYLAPEELIPIPFNQEVYKVEEFDFVVATIKRYGVLDPLIVQETEDRQKYHIVSGERRYHAFMKALADGDGRQDLKQGIPCRILPASISSIEIRLLLIIANATSRNMGIAEKMQEFHALVEVFRDLERESIDVGYGIKEIAISQYHISERQYQRYMSIESAIEELRDFFHKDEFETVTFAQAAAIAGKPEDVQRLIYRRYQEGMPLLKAYEQVSDELKEFRAETKEHEARVASIEQKLETLTETLPESAEEVLEVRKELQQAKKEKKEHVRNREKKLEKKLSEPKPEKKDKEDKTEKTAPTHSVITNNPFMIAVPEALSYVENGVRALSIHSKTLSSADLAKLKELQEQLDRTIKVVEGIQETAPLV